MTEKRPTYHTVDDARADIYHVEAGQLNDGARACMDALSARRMLLYRDAWQGNPAARDELRALYLALSALTACLPEAAQ